MRRLKRNVARYRLAQAGVTRINRKLKKLWRRALAGEFDGPANKRRNKERRPPRSNGKSYAAVCG